MAKPPVVHYYKRATVTACGLRTTVFNMAVTHDVKKVTCQRCKNFIYG